MTSALKIIDQELAQFGWVESIATNSISDLKAVLGQVELTCIQSIDVSIQDNPVVKRDNSRC